jgi:hypothetical protein
MSLVISPRLLFTPPSRSVHRKQKMNRKKHVDDFERNDFFSESSELDSEKPSNVSFHKCIRQSYYTLTSKQKLLILLCTLCLISGIIFSCYHSRSEKILLNYLDRVQKISNSELLKHQLSLNNPSSSFYTTSSQYSRKCSRMTPLSLPSFLKSNTKQSHHEITVIVYAGRIKDQHPGFANFLSSLKLAGFSDILMKEPPGQEILSHIGTPNNTLESMFWVQRLEEFQLVASTYPPDHLLLICDSFDVIFGLSISTFLSRFESLKSDIIFSTEMLCDTISCRNDNWLSEWFRHRSPNPRNPYHYLNAGLLVGRAQSLNLFLICSLKYAKNGRDDQTSFALCFHEFHSTAPEILRVELDYNSLLFGNIPPIDLYFDQNWVVDEEKHIRSENIFQTSAENLLPENSFISRLSGDPQGAVTPVAIHFPGMAYRPSYTLFNPCQQFLRWKYNQIGSSSFAHGDIPNIFHPRPIVNTFQFIKDSSSPSDEAIRKFNILKSNQEYRVAVTLVVEHGKRAGEEFVNQLYRDIFSLFEQNRFVHVSRLYLLVLTTQNSHTKLVSQEELSSRLQEFQEFVEILIVLSPTASILETVLREEPLDSKERESLPSLMVMLWQSTHPIQYNFLDHFYKRYLLDPGAVYGFGGWMIDEVSGFEGVQWKLKSAALWHDSLASVDVLDFANGIIFQRSFFDDSFSDFMMTSSSGCQCGQRGDEEIKISAYLSSKAIPRIQLPADPTKLQQQTSLSGNGNQNGNVAPCECQFLPLLDHFRHSWLSPKDEESCPTNSFQSLRVIDNLPGFSWQLNWDPNSHTSACTTHLVTHVSPTAHFVGVGQYLSENHRIYSPRKRFMIQLEPGARLCLYSLDDSKVSYATSPTRCLEPPHSPLSSEADSSSVPTTPHYLAIDDGQLCFYSGKSPYFGSTKKESGHTALDWCTSSSYPPPRHQTTETRRRLLREQGDSPALQALKDRMKQKIAEILQKQMQEEIHDCQSGGNEIESEYWESVYLHVTDDGIFGLFYSSNTEPSDRMTAEKRIDSFVMAKCF